MQPQSQSQNMALSKIPDLTHTYKGQEYTFVDQLEDYLKELECPICHSIVSEPQLTSCGHLFCTECYGRLRGIKRTLGSRIAGSVQCPVCKQEYTTVEDSRTNRRVKTLQVRCMNHQYGCKWVGNLSDEMQHRMTQGSCQFEDIPCPQFCGRTIRRMTLSCHYNECTMSLCTCKYCGEQGPYMNIEGKHRDTCRRYPVPCPNGCKVRITRENTSSYKLSRTISDMEGKLQGKKYRISELEKEAKGMAEHIHRLEKENNAMTKKVLALETDAAATNKTVRARERDNRNQTECIRALQRDTASKAERLSELEEETEAKAARIHELEWDTNAKSERIRGLERETEAKTECIRDLEGDIKAKTECIGDHERVAKAKAKHIRDLEKISSRNMQRITQLTEEKSAKQKKVKHIKMFTVFALGVIVLLHLHPLSIILLLIILHIAYA